MHKIKSMKRQCGLRNIYKQMPGWKRKKLNKIWWVMNEDWRMNKWVKNWIK